MFEMFSKTVSELWAVSAFANMTAAQGFMILVSFFLMYLAIVRKYEPMLLLPIAFGMCLTNLPGSNMYHPELWDKVNMIAAVSVSFTVLTGKAGAPALGARL